MRTLDHVTDTILVLTEDTLTQTDVEHLLGMHPDESLEFRLLVPADTEQPLLATVLDNLGLGDLAAAMHRITSGEPNPEEAKTTAQTRLERSQAQFAAAGVTVTGEVVSDDPIPALTTAMQTHSVREIFVVTYPHMVEDTLHTDWASRARDHFKIPVLHLYSGTSTLG